MERKVRITVEIEVRDVGCRLANALYSAVKPEASLKLRGVNMSVVRKDCSVVIDINAPEVASALPVVNNILKLMATSIDVIQTSQDRNKRVV